MTNRTKGITGPAATPCWEGLRKLIVQDCYKSGDRLPSERELAQRLKVGRPAIREAIKALSILEIVESRPGAGTFVRSASSVSLRWPETRHVNLAFDMLQLLEIRKMIEPQAAALCAMRGSIRQVSELEQYLMAEEADPDDPGAIARSDYLFHDVIIRSAGNSILDDIVNFLSPLLVHSRQLTASTSPDFKKMAREHRAIFESIRRGQPDLAAQAMTEHLLTVGLDLIVARDEMITSAKLDSVVGRPPAPVEAV
jgi:GntR family transcriptional repressor for pyruvate dehydrogenase complex